MFLHGADVISNFRLKVGSSRELTIYFRLRRTFESKRIMIGI